jgi:hypothetical protein
MFTLTTPSSPTSESTTLALAADLGVAGTCSGPPPSCSVARPSWQSDACVGEKSQSLASGNNASLTCA